MTAIASKLDVRKLTARIGAEVTGLDLSAALDAQTVSQIRTALNDHKALGGFWRCSQHCVSAGAIAHGLAQAYLWRAPGRYWCARPSEVWRCVGW